jgi:hypothetical protein
MVFNSQSVWLGLSMLYIVVFSVFSDLPFSNEYPYWCPMNSFYIVVTFIATLPLVPFEFIMSGIHLVTYIVLLSIFDSRSCVIS